MNVPQPTREPPQRNDAGEWIPHEQGTGETMVDLVSHGIGITASIAGLIVLLVLGSRLSGALPVTTYAIYGGSLLLAFVASTFYHAFRRHRITPALRVADHSSIYVLIAGTYTPVTLVGISGAWGWSLFGIVWGLALLGVLLKVLFPGCILPLAALALPQLRLAPLRHRRGDGTLFLDHLFRSTRHVV
jgi:predicted membrane channel-forming protein YqfA (hemolysin III family)